MTQVPTWWFGLCSEAFSGSSPYHPLHPHISGHAFVVRQGCWRAVLVKVVVVVKKHR